MKTSCPKRALHRLSWLLVLVVVLAGLAAPPTLAFDHPRDDGHGRRADPDDPPKPDEPPDEPEDECSATGSPVYLRDGNLVLTFTDLPVNSRLPLDVRRTYNSRDGRNGAVGRGWTHSYELRAIPITDGLTNGAIVRWFNGQRLRFTQQPDGSFAEPLGCPVQLAGLEIRQNDGISFETDHDGDLVRIHDRSGNVATVVSDPVRGCVDAIDFERGRVQVAHGANGKIASITAPGGHSVTYQYDAAGNLVGVTDPETGASTTYVYDLQNRLTEIRNPDGQTTLRVFYDASGRVSRTVDREGDFSYAYSSGRTVKTDTTSGGRWTIDFDGQGVVTRITDPLNRSEVRGYDALYNLTSLTDRNGHTTFFTYDLAGNQLGMTDALGNTTSWTYDHHNLPLTVTDPMGRVTTYEYDEEGRLSKVTEPSGGVTSYTYDAAGNLLTETDALGRTTVHTYDGAGNRISTVDRTGTATIFQYDAAGNLVSETRAGAATTSTYDSRARKLSQTDALGETTRWEYDLSGRLRREISPTGGVTLTDYDAFDRPLRQVLPDGQEIAFAYGTTGSPAAPYRVTASFPGGISYELHRDPYFRDVRFVERSADGATREHRYEYDGEGNLTAHVDPEGRRFGRRFDPLGRLVEESTATGASLTTAYNPDGTVASVVQPGGNTHVYEYDAAGKLIRVSDDYGVVQEPQLDPLDRPTSRPDGITEAIAYDAEGRTTAVEYADGTGMSLSLDEAGRVVAVTLPTGTIHYAYDDAGRQSSMTLEDGSVLSAEYDAEGRVTALTDAAGQVQRLAYFPSGAVEREIYPDGSERAFTYLLGSEQITSVTQTDGSVLDYSYGPSGRLEQASYPDGTSDTFVYNGQGSLTTASNGAFVISRSEDEMGRLIQASQGAHEVGYAYAGDHLTATITYPSGRQITRVVDGRGRLVELREGATVLFRRSFDALDMPVQGTFGNGVTVDWSFAGDRQPAAITHSAGGQPLVDLRYRLEENGSGLVGSKEDLVEPLWSEQYLRDARGRLVESRRGFAGVDGSVPSPEHLRRWQLDGVGNWLQVERDGVVESRTHDSLHQTVAVDGAPLTYDGRGNLVSDGELLYAWDYNNRLVRVNDAASGDLVAAYGYDALGRRVTKSLPGTLIEYVYDGQRLIEEIRNGLTWATYVYLDGTYEIVQADIAGSSYYFHHDAIGNVVALSDATGNVVERYRYSPYGEVEAFDGAGQPLSVGLNERLFTGLQLDPETGLYFARHRYYSPELGRFLSRDPLSVYATGGVIGLYAYADLDPITFFDPSGLAATKTCSGHRVKIGVPETGIPSFLKRFLGSPKGEVLIEYKTCERCCPDGSKKVTERSGSVTANLVWQPPCVPVPTPFGLLGGKTPTGCFGVYIQVFFKLGGQAFWQEDKCGGGCRSGGCLVGTLGAWLRGGAQGSFGSAWAGGSLSGSGNFCATGKCSGEGPNLVGQFCVNGKLAVRFELKKWWIFGRTGGIYYEYTFWQGSLCNQVKIL